MSRLIIESKVFEGIPYNEYYLDRKTHKGLVFVQHGYESNKNKGSDYLAVTLGRLGFFVVALDAYKHGERKEEPYLTKEDAYRYAEMLDVVEQTAKDYIYIHEKLYSNKYPTYDFVGVSMGGFIAYLLSTMTSKIDKLVPAITSPMLYKLATTLDDFDGKETFKREIKPKLNHIKKIDPFINLHLMKYKKMFVLNGIKDDVIDVEETREFKDVLNSNNAIFKEYDEWHATNDDMQKDIFEFIANEKVVL